MKAMRAYYYWTKRIKKLAFVPNAANPNFDMRLTLARLFAGIIQERTMLSYQSISGVISVINTRVAEYRSRNL